jgi:hypothetical protein
MHGKIGQKMERHQLVTLASISLQDCEAEEGGSAETGHAQSGVGDEGGTRVGVGWARASCGLGAAEASHRDLGRCARAGGAGGRGGGDGGVAAVWALSTTGMVGTVKMISVDQGRLQVGVTYRHLSEHVLSPLQAATHWVPHAWQM